MEQMVYNEADVLICGTLVAIEDIDLKGLSVRKRAIFSVEKGVIREPDKELGALLIPMIVQDIVLVKDKSALYSKDPLKEKALGTAEILELNKKYLITADFIKIIREMEDGTNRKLTHIDVKELYLMEDTDKDRNYVKGEFTLKESPRVETTDSSIYGSLKLMGESIAQPRLTAYARGKNANFCTQLKKGDRVTIGGSLYPNVYGIFDSEGNCNLTDSFCIYLHQISN